MAFILGCAIYVEPEDLFEKKNMLYLCKPSSNQILIVAEAPHAFQSFWQKPVLIPEIQKLSAIALDVHDFHRLSV